MWRMQYKARSIQLNGAPVVTTRRSSISGAPGDIRAGIAALELVDAAPAGGASPPVQKPGFAQKKGPGSRAAHQSAARMLPPHPCRNPREMRHSRRMPRVIPAKSGRQNGVAIGNLPNDVSTGKLRPDPSMMLPPSALAVTIRNGGSSPVA